METVLYEYSYTDQLNLIELLKDFIPLLVGVFFLGISITHTFFRKKLGLHDLSCAELVFIIIGFAIGPLLISAQLGSFAEILNKSQEYKYALDIESVREVEGFVENYHAMPYEGGDTEHFTINGIYFDYTDYESKIGYHKSASHGGVITHDGQHLRIKYIEEEYIVENTSEMNSNDTMDNPFITIKENGEVVWQDRIILYIAEIKGK